MSMIPTTKPSTVTPEMEARFRELADRWLDETMFISSTTVMVEHPALNEIVAMGEAVIPLVLREMEKETGHWDLAMSRITGFNPVPVPDRGKISLTMALWLKWGKEQGYQW